MNILFRTDASLQIGSGHVMRCLTLADELRQCGAGISFVCREHPGNLIGLIEGKGYPVVRLPQSTVEYTASPDDVDHAAWLGLSWQQDALATIAATEEIQPDWLIIDHYAVDHRWEEQLRPHVGKIMVIDDLADRQHNCDLLLDQNLYQAMERRYAGLIPQDSAQLLGPRFALLRQEFAAARARREKCVGKVRRILVFMGGSDLANATCKVLDALQLVARPELQIDVVIGPQMEHRADIQSRCRNMRQVTCHEQVTDMVGLMAQADLAIGAGGTTVWERACLGLPSLVVSIADNQTAVAESVGERGCCLYLGRATEVTAIEISHALATLCKTPELLRHFSSASAQLTDGRGVERVVRRLIKSEVQLRPAVIADCEAIYLWRNAPEVRVHFFDPEPILWEDHQHWFSRVLENPDRILLIGEVNGQPVGVVRYDLNESEATVSVYLVPDQLGQGYGVQLLRAADQWLLKTRPDIRCVKAEILPGNKASKQAFVAAGYVEKHSVFCRHFEV